MKKESSVPLRINFADFWSDFDPSNNFISRLLSDCTAWTLSDSPDLLFCSGFGISHRKYKCKKVYYTGENWLPNPWSYDYFFSFQPGALHQRNYRMPCWVTDDGCEWGWVNFKRREDLRPYEIRRFCNFLYSNNYAKTRQRFFHLLNSRKRIDSAGRVLRNIDRVVGPGAENKLSFLSEYRFTIAFENESFRHYCTEKIVQPFMVGSIPIYLGDSEVAQDFNPESFVNCHDFPDFESVVERVLQIDNDPVMWKKMSIMNPFREGQPPAYALRDNALRQLDWIISQPRLVVNTRCTSMLAKIYDQTHRVCRYRKLPGFTPLMRIASYCWPLLARKDQPVALIH